MNNLYANSGLRPKYIIADIDTYKKGPEDDTYANFPVNYLKIDKTPGPDDDVSPVLKALRDGNFFVTTGEILITNYAVAGTGAQRIDRRRRRMDVPAVVRRSGVGRRQEDRPAGDFGHRPRRVRHQALRDSVRRDRQSRGCGSRCGTRRATARSCSRCG